MDIESIKNQIYNSRGLASTLGIELVSTPEENVCVGRMSAGRHVCQPFGCLSGGATLALAETLAGAGSLVLCPGQMCMGVNVSGNHIKAVREGDTVTARARLLHRGRRLHHWLVGITDGNGELVSSVQVTNYIKEKDGK